MALRFAFAGFRHSHILDLYELVQEREGLEAVAAAEDEPNTRERLREVPRAVITHDTVQEMLEAVDCDVVAIGDYFSRRGELAIAALRSGRHVISDKPLCTSLGELGVIEELVGNTGLSVGCMLTMRDSPQMIGVRQRLEAGELGEVHAITFGGQHPLLRSSRASWYFEEGKQGGTINDIAVHAIDAIPWVTGLEFTTLNAARCWTAYATGTMLMDAAQLMLTMNNGCGVLGDVSYAMPDAAGYSLPLYWRTTFWGQNGVLETSANCDQISVALAADPAMRRQDLPAGTSGGYLTEFVSDIEGTVRADQRSTAAVLRAARTVLCIQAAADDGHREVAL